MKNKKGEFSFACFLLNSLITLCIISVVILIAYLVYVGYVYNVPGEPENLNVLITEQNPAILENQTLSEVRQFNTNMKFNHNAISYHIFSDCEEDKKSRMLEAFNYLSNEVGIISFYESLQNPDIEVSCSEKNKDSEVKSEYFIAGEGGAKEIIQTGKYNVITNGTILLYKSMSNSIKCDTPNVEIHELIHVFGFDHSQSQASIMNPYLSSCNQRLDPSIVSELKRLYSLENLPDIYFENISAVKKGKYLDFNLTVKNAGTINANKVILSILDDNELAETRDLGDIDYGAGILVRITNLKLVHLNPSQIQFIIDRDNKINELDKANNIAEVKFSE